MSKSRSSENFSRMVVALVIVTIAVGAIAWFFSTFDPVGCAVGIPCHRGEAAAPKTQY